MQNKNNSRRRFLKNSGLLIAGTTILNTNLVGETLIKPGESLLAVEKISPTEHLMRDHGLLKRILLIYQEIMDRINKKSSFPPETVIDSANTIRMFIEANHEQMEENYLFPHFKKANTLVELVHILVTQHQKGSDLTSKIVQLGADNFKKNKEKEQLKKYLYSFIRMLSAHEAREDTVLFPAFRKLISETEYESLGEQLAQKEFDMFGPNGFELMLHRVEDIEKKLKIYELSKFTPKV